MASSLRCCSHPPLQTQRRDTGPKGRGMLVVEGQAGQHWHAISPLLMENPQAAGSCGPNSGSVSRATHVMSLTPEPRKTSYTPKGNWGGSPPEMQYCAPGLGTMIQANHTPMELHSIHFSVKIPRSTRNPGRGCQVRMCRCPATPPTSPPRTLVCHSTLA